MVMNKEQLIKKIKKTFIKSGKKRNISIVASPLLTMTALFVGLKIANIINWAWILVIFPLYIPLLMIIFKIIGNLLMDFMEL